jgi:hypothetical protein
LVGHRNKVFRASRNRSPRELSSGAAREPVHRAVDIERSLHEGDWRRPLGSAEQLRIRPGARSRDPLHATAECRWGGVAVCAVRTRSALPDWGRDRKRGWTGVADRRQIVSNRAAAEIRVSGLIQGRSLRASDDAPSARIFGGCGADARARHWSDDGHPQRGERRFFDTRKKVCLSCSTETARPYGYHLKKSPTIRVRSTGQLDEGGALTPSRLSRRADSCRSAARGDDRTPLAIVGGGQLPRPAVSDV